MSHPLQCSCGTLQGTLDNPQSGHRVVCYCRDCQAFAYFLGRADEILDERGGSDIVQVLPRNITFTQGVEKLACMRLTDKGLLRWYASCCHTPIGNTLATPKMSFIGLVHTCLESRDRRLQDAFGPIRGWVNTGGARGNPKPKAVGQGATIFWFIGHTLKARFNGDYKRTPLFRADTGAPVVEPRVLTSGEHETAMNAVQAAAARGVR